MMKLVLNTLTEKTSATTIGTHGDCIYQNLLLCVLNDLYDKYSTLDKVVFIQTTAYNKQESF